MKQSANVRLFTHIPYFKLATCPPPDKTVPQTYITGHPGNARVDARAHFPFILRRKVEIGVAWMTQSGKVRLFTHIPYFKLATCPPPDKTVPQTYITGRGNARLDARASFPFIPSQKSRNWVAWMTGKVLKSDFFPIYPTSDLLRAPHQIKLYRRPISPGPGECKSRRAGIFSVYTFAKESKLAWHG